MTTFASRIRNLWLALAAFSLAPVAHATVDDEEGGRPAASEEHVRTITAPPRRPQVLENWRPSGSIPKATLDKIVSEIRKQADEDDHTYCLFDTSDNCFLRNTKIKFDLKERGVDISNSTATVMIVESGELGKWGYHTAAVFYTDRGPFVFDPDNKDPNAVYDGDLLTPLDQWLKVEWSFDRPVTFLAPPGVIVPSDMPEHPAYFPDGEAKAKYWDQFSDRTPNDPLFLKVRGAKITAMRVSRYRTLCPALPASSKENYINLKNTRLQAAAEDLAPAARPAATAPRVNPSPNP